jgi:hypothetical protein
MLAACPSFTHRVANSLPPWLEVCNFENSRVKLNNLLESNELGVSHRSLGAADELPAMVIGIVRHQQYRLRAIQDLPRRKRGAIAWLVERPSVCVVGFHSACADALNDPILVIS